MLAVDPMVSADDPQTVRELFADTYATRRRLLVLLASAASIVLVLTALSVVSTLGQFISARRREIAIRLAIGAERRHVITLLGRHVGIAFAFGLVAGAGTGLVLGRTIATQLFGVAPTDAVTFVGSVVLLTALATSAAVPSVWRASRISPISALKAQ